MKFLIRNDLTVTLLKQTFEHFKVRNILFKNTRNTNICQIGLRCARCCKKSGHDIKV